jgi:hypothetical protein
MSVDRRAAGAAAAVLLAGALAIGLSSSRGRDRDAGESPRPSRWEALAHAMAAPWPALQGRSGRLADYTDRLPGVLGRHRGTRYGDAVTGYALIDAGLRERDRELVGTGIRAVSYATDPERRPSRPSVFEQLGVAGAYNLARRRLADDPGFARARPRWERWLRRVRIVELQHVNRYYNHWLVDAVGVLELQRTGLRSDSRAAALGGGARRARRLAEQLINVRIPGLLPKRGAAVFSDAPDNPTAYHGLSLGLYARAVHLLGSRAAPAARRVLLQSVWTAAAMMAPNGSIAYIGRSQEEAWAPAGAAYGAAYAARLPGASRALTAVAGTVAYRSLERLETAYPIGRGGIAITPAVGAGLGAARYGLDGYAGAPSMGGIALMMVNWTLAERPPERSPGRLPAAYPLATTISHDRSRFAVVRSGATWFAAKLSRSGSERYRGDLRYDAGLAFAMRRERGRWRELVPQRPRTEVDGRASAAPVLLNGGPAEFFGDAIDVSARGTVRLSGAFLNRAAPIRRASLVYRPVGCGVALAFGAQAGDAYRMSGFFSRRPRLTATTATDGRQTMRVSADDVALRLAPDRLGSGDRPRLWRVEAIVRAQGAGRIAVRYCAPR